MLDFRTINELFEHLSHRGEAVVAQWLDGTEWTPITSRQMYGRVRATVELLRRWGIRRGDRVGILSENRWEWPVVDFAVLAIGAVDVPLYQTSTPDQVGFVLRDAGVKAVLVSNRQQFAKLIQAGPIESLEHVAVFDPGPWDNAESLADALLHASQLESPDPAFDALLRETRPDELASLIYTSGTTGDPKGVMLTHRNLADNLRHSTDGLRIGAGDWSISFLPLGHSLARHLDYAMYGNAAAIAYLPRFDDLVAAMKAVRPTIFLAVPRVFEKVRQATEHKATGARGRILRWALARGRAHRRAILAGRRPFGLGWWLADKLVFSKLRQAFGGRARVFVSGGAPLGNETIDWFLSVGIRIFEGYGMTETSPVISRNTFDAYRPGTVGQILPNLKVRLAPDGEIEVRGSSVFAGYWRRDEETRREFTPDGWFRTGDVGSLADGFLSITDRKKELLKTSGGKYIAPQPIEGQFKADPLVAYAAMVGDSRKFASMIISPDFPALERWAREHGVSSTDRQALVRDPKVQQQFDALAKTINRGLEHHETIKKVRVVPDDWSVETGELTPSLKLKRRIILQKYADRINEIYRD